MTPILETILTGILYFPILMAPVFLLLGYALSDAHQVEVENPGSESESADVR